MVARWRPGRSAARQLVARGGSLAPGQGRLTARPRAAHRRMGKAQRDEGLAGKGRNKGGKGIEKTTERLIKERGEEG